MRAWWWCVVGCAWWWGCAGALRCLRCGQYSDGVGSITPCTNSSGAVPVDCAAEHKHCIKYVSELTTVRDCVPTCTEKEWWGARTFCCDTDDCNAAPVSPTVSPRVLLLVLTGAFLTAHLLAPNGLRH